VYSSRYLSAIVCFVCLMCLLLKTQFFIKPVIVFSIVVVVIWTLLSEINIFDFDYALRVKNCHLAHMFQQLAYI